MSDDPGLVFRKVCRIPLIRLSVEVRRQVLFHDVGVRHEIMFGGCTVYFAKLVDGEIAVLCEQRLDSQVR